MDINKLNNKHTTNTNNHFTALVPGLPGWANATRKSSSGLLWCKGG